MSDMLENIVAARAGGRVERAHGIYHHGSYSNAAHQWGVAMLMHALWPEDFPRLALHCLSHDVPEAWVGDVPSPTMRYVPGLKEQLGVYEREINLGLGLPAEQDLPEEDYNKLKACDRLELYLWALEQRMVGNLFVEGTIIELERFFVERPLPERAHELYLEARSSYNLPPTQAGVMKELTSGGR